MAVFRVEKNSGYTVMSNHHLRNRALSLKAKGLLSQMLSLPEDWDYTLQGLARINRESIDAIRQAIRELEQTGYIQRSRERDEKGRLRGADYVIFELPQPVPASVSTVMEGAKRPGHFNGVCQVVSRLFYIVRPNRAYFGEKDWQQIAVIKQLVKYINSDVKIVECPIIRDEDGLAKSSRNTLLAPDERAIAPNIYKALKASVEYAKNHTVQETHDKVVNDINAVDGLEVEYFQIVDGDSLQDVASWEDSAYVVGCITVYCGKTPIRLIDHIKYKG